MISEQVMSDAAPALTGAASFVKADVKAVMQDHLHFTALDDSGEMREVSGTVPNLPSQGF